MCDEEYADAVDAAVFPGAQGGPAMHNVAGKAVGFAEALDESFVDYAEAVVENARALADVFAERGLDPVSGGTDTHLVLVDLRPSHPDLSGGTAEEHIADAGIVLNANTVPDETRSPFDPSGIRAGTAALTTRGMGTAAIREVGGLIADLVDAAAAGEADEVVPEVRAAVDDLTDEYPLYEAGGAFEYE